MGARALNRPAFTLLEVLVVTVIMGLLAAVMTPALSQARQRAKRVACTEVLHGLSIGIKTYLQDNNEIYPASAQMPSVNIHNEPLPVTLQGYVSAARGFRCPADDMGYVRASDQQAFASYFDGEGLSYDYNMALGGRRIENAFLFSIFGESSTYVLQDFDNFHAPTAPLCKNLLFADAHVGTIDDVLAALGSSSGSIGSGN